MSTPHSPLNKEKLRRLYKEEKARIEEEKKYHGISLEKQRKEDEKKRAEAREKRIDNNVAHMLAQVKRACKPGQWDQEEINIPKLTFWIGFAEECKETAKRLRSLNCDTTEIRGHSTDPKCCRPSWLVGEPVPCIINLIAVDFWSAPSPERNAE